MTCKRCEIHEAWLAVRNARTYEGVVDRAAEWLQLFWLEARSLNLSGRSLREVPCPPVFISSSLGAASIGKWTGKSIQLCEKKHRMATFKELRQVHREAHPRIRDELRDTILHEVQHAIDEYNGIGSTRNDDLVADHPPAFHWRLDKLKRAFPIDGA